MQVGKWINKLTDLYGPHTVYGPYVRKQDGRRVMTLRFADGRMVHKQYAKFKLEVKLGRILGKDETVDHIDRNPTNDKFGNLQLLSKKEHSSLDAKRVKRKHVVCQWCNSIFKATVKQILKSSQTKAGPFCSKRCIGSYGAMVQNGGPILSRKKIKRHYCYKQK